MSETWNISLIGIVFAVGELGIIATFFAIVGHFFKRNSERKKNSKSLSSPAIVEEKKIIQKKSVKDIQQTAEKVETIEEEEELVAVMSAAIMAYAPMGGKIVSINHVNEEKRVTSHSWRLHNPRTTWRIGKVRRRTITSSITSRKNSRVNED